MSFRMLSELSMRSLTFPITATSSENALLDSRRASTDWKPAVDRMDFEPELTGLANALLKSAMAAVNKVVDFILSRFN